ARSAPDDPTQQSGGTTCRAGAGPPRGSRPMTRSLRLLGPFLRKHWSALGGAAASTVAVTAAELAQPWPLKLVLDSLLGGHRQRPFAPGVRDLALLAAIAGLVLAIALVDAYASFAGDFWLKR